jgi:tRNA uridine 5-carboxymethylaminomethyl modification enzyme
MGRTTLCITMNLDRIGHLPCNCSIGGPAKGHMAREVDALGGQMGLTTDLALTHIRRVGTGRGPAVQTARAHVCKRMYPNLMRKALEEQANLSLLEGTVETVLGSSRVVGARVVVDGVPVDIEARTVVLTTGTFLNGLCHEGMKKTVAGRFGEDASFGLSRFLRSVGIRLKRFKTGTTPRIRLSTIDFTAADVVESEPDAGPFSFLNDAVQPARDLLPCWEVWTNEEMHNLIRENLFESAMYGGQIEGVGPRYCPSIEDKVVRFADKKRHPVFLEIEEWGGESVYVQGVSTSLPASIQLEMLRKIRGLEQVEMLRPGYAVEYDMADPLQLNANLMSQQMEGLFLAGQINGTSGYEEAAGQGLVAGINAARYAADEDPVSLGRESSFIGVMIDDLVVKGVDDPYRMLTARAEHRLLLRHDNADARLTPLSRSVGLCDERRWERFCEKTDLVEKGLAAMGEARVSRAQAAEFERREVVPPSQKVSMLELLRRPDISLSLALEIAEACGISIEMSPRADVREQVELAGIYGGYLERQRKAVARARRLDSMAIPNTMDFQTIRGLSHESREKLTRVRPRTIGQMSRIPGVRMSDVALLIGHIRAGNRG